MTTLNTFIHKLTLSLGYKTKQELLHTMSHKEFLEWQEYYKENPFPNEVLELQLGIISEMIYKQGFGDDKIAMEFMPSFDKDVIKREKQLQKQKSINDALSSFGT